MRLTRNIAVKAVVGSILAMMALSTGHAQPVLYGGLGGRGVSSGPQASTNDGSLVIVSQTNWEHHGDWSSRRRRENFGACLRLGRHAVRRDPGPRWVSATSLSKLCERADSN